jgi:hypothetical protein
VGNVKTVTMKARTAPTARPNRILIALAAAWMIVSLAVGGALADPDAGQVPPTRATTADRAVQR